MKSLVTVYSSNSPIDCAIVKGMLVTNDILCFTFDDNYLWLHPYEAVALGGVKLKVPVGKKDQALELIKEVLTGEYLNRNILLFQNEMAKEEEVLRIKTEIRTGDSNIISQLLTKVELSVLNKEEEEFKAIKESTYKFSWKEFITVFFDTDRSIFDYLRPISNSYYLSKDEVDRFNREPIQEECSCTFCGSNNVRSGISIKEKWRLWYLIFSLIISGYPLPIYSKRVHCFDCGEEYKEEKDRL